MKKSLKTTSQTNEFFYMVNSKTEKMQKFMIHQGEKINSRLNEKSEYIPPFQVFFLIFRHVMKTVTVPTKSCRREFNFQGKICFEVLRKEILI
jgi:hypothetical protein